jgi:hypothetical protein
MGGAALFGCDPLLPVAPELQRVLARDPVHLDIANHLDEPLNAALLDVDPFPALLQAFGAQLGRGAFIDIEIIDRCQHQRRRRLATQQRRLLLDRSAGRRNGPGALHQLADRQLGQLGGRPVVKAHGLGRAHGRLIDFAGTHLVITGQHGAP